jgi:hypothetical protein
MNNTAIKQLSMDPKWLTDFAYFLNQDNNKKELEEVKTIFVDTYMDNIHDGMNTKDAFQNAKTIALGFSHTKQ